LTITLQIFCSAARSSAGLPLAISAQTPESWAFSDEVSDVDAFSPDSQAAAAAAPPASAEPVLVAVGVVVAGVVVAGVVLAGVVLAGVFGLLLPQPAISAPLAAATINSK
jgi:hypothetical protein